MERQISDKSDSAETPLVLKCTRVVERTSLVIIIINSISIFVSSKMYD